MATKRQCEAALRALARKLREHAETHGIQNAPHRTVMCRIPDLGTCFSGELRDGRLEDIAEQERSNAQIVLTVDSDDLIAVTGGTLPVAAAWASGRLRIDASVRDLLRVRSLL